MARIKHPMPVLKYLYRYSLTFTSDPTETQYNFNEWDVIAEDQWHWTVQCKVDTNEYRISKIEKEDADWYESKTDAIAASIATAQDSVQSYRKRIQALMQAISQLRQEPT